MAKVLIVAAMQEEISDLARNIGAPPWRGFSELLPAQIADFYIAWQGHQVATAIVEVGKVRSTLNTTKLVSTYQPDVLLLTGSAGALNPQRNLLDTVVPVDIWEHDFQVAAFAPDLQREHHWKLSDSAVQLLTECASAVLPAGSVHQGGIASGDQVVADSQLRERIWQATKADLVEMETAAIAEVAFRFQLPFLPWRIASDGAGENAEVAFDQTLSEIARRGTRIAAEVLKYVDQFVGIPTIDRFQRA